MPKINKHLDRIYRCPEEKIPAREKELSNPLIIWYDNLRVNPLLSYFSMDDIFQKEYAEYLETTLKELVTLPVEGICILAKLQGGATYTSFHKSSITDKILYAGLIQQDAMIETLEKNRMIRGQEGDE